MNLYALLPLAGLMTNLFLGFYIFLKNRHMGLNRIYIFFSMSMVLWSLSSTMIFSAAGPAEAIVWDKLETIGSSLAAVSLLHFFILFTKSGFLSRKRNLMALYAPAIFFIVINLSSDMITTGMEKVYWGYTLIPGPIYYLDAAYIATYAILGVFICFLFSRRTKDDDEKSQAVFLYTGMSITIIAGLITEGIMPIFDIRLVPLTSTAITINAIFVAYAMLRHRLMYITREIAAETIIKTMADYLIVLDGGRKIAITSDSVKDLTGKEEGLLVGKRLSDVFEEKGGVLQKIMNDLTSTGRTIRDRETYIKIKGGEYTSFSVNASVIKGSPGDVIGFVLILRDMSQVKKLIKGIEEKSKELEKSKKDLEKNNNELARFNKMAVGRELKMIELKKEIAKLKKGK